MLGLPVSGKDKSLLMLGVIPLMWSQRVGQGIMRDLLCFVITKVKANIQISHLSGRIKGQKAKKSLLAVFKQTVLSRNAERT